MSFNGLKMLRALFGPICLLALAGCDTLERMSAQVAQNAEPEVSCRTRPDGCAFDQGTLRVDPEPRVLPRRSYQFFPTADELNFTDARGRRWVAPKGTLTDGASIPEIFVAIVGQPTAPEYIHAAAVHDAYCGVGNELGVRFHDGRWEDVHRMFYDGLITGGTPPLRAKVMYAAVWLGGPRWNTHRDLRHLSVGDKQDAMRRVKLFIEDNDPPLPALVAFLEAQEKGMQAQAAGKDEEKLQSEVSPETPPGAGGELPPDPTPPGGGGGIDPPLDPPYLDPDPPGAA